MKQILTFFLIVCVYRASVVQTHAAEPAQPNIILILADDIGAKEFSCYGSKEHRTPNLDRMAAEGTRFETFYVMPKCTPTRVALMTGQYGFHTGYLGMSNKAWVPAKDSPQHDIANHFTHAKLLKSAGYTTALVGKWQLSGKLPTLIHDAGFDDYLMWAYDQNLPAGITHPAHQNDGETVSKRDATSRYWQPCLMENGKYIPTTPQDFGPDFFNDYVINYARSQREKPFFIHYTSVLTHSPRVETPDPEHPGQHWPAGLKSNLEYLDHLTGKLLASLKTNGLDENTIVIFVGDNGTGGDGKGQASELGARVPFIVRGPGIKPGVVSRALGDVTDLLPTLAEFAGAALPKDKTFDGKSLAPLLRGETDKHRDWIYAHYEDGRVLRDPRWLLEFPAGGKPERFFDCGENRDGTSYKNVTASTDPEAKAARAHFADILATIPPPKPNEGVTSKPAKKKKK